MPVLALEGLSGLVLDVFIDAPWAAMSSLAAALGVTPSSFLGVTSSLENLTLSHADSFVFSTVFSAPLAAFTASV